MPPNFVLAAVVIVVAIAVGSSLAWFLTGIGAILGPVATAIILLVGIPPFMGSWDQNS